MKYNIQKTITKMKRLKNSLFGFALLASLLLPLNTVQAQAQNEKGITPEEIEKINTDRKLVADKVNTKMETAAIDSVRMLFEMAEEDEDMSPADELYEGVWNNQFVKAYSGVSIPDTFRIDLSSFIMPFIGKITSPFGPRRRRFHYGTDLKLQVGDTVVAAFEGKIRVEQFERRGYGNYLVLRHPNGLETVYGHLSEFLVHEGETVEAGQPIALGGNTGRSTGSHLHFECRFLGQAIDPADIVDFDNACTYDDSYLFHRYNVNAISAHNTKYSTSKYTAKSNRSFTYHRVRSGDTLSRIAQRYGVSVKQICRLNGIKANTRLKVGRVIRCS
jgi:murein DD-endopeptidase MepM/ murein hydrolase activator NlpD